MRKLLFTVAFAVLGFTVSYAQKSERTKLSAEERAEKAAMVMQEKLNLTANQKSKIQQIELDRIQQQDELQKKDIEAMRAKFEARKATMKAHQEKVDAVLTAEQKIKLAASREEIMSKMSERKGRSPRTARTNKTPTQG